MSVLCTSHLHSQSFFEGLFLWNGKSQNKTNKQNKQIHKKKLKEMCTLLSSNRAQAFIYFKTSRREKEGRVAPLNSAMNVFLGMISAIEHCWVFKIFNAIIFFGKNTLHTINWKIQHWYVFYCIFYVTRVWSYQGCVYVSQLKSQLISAWSQPNELVGGMMRKTTQQSVTH